MRVFMVTFMCLNKEPATPPHLLKVCEAFALIQDAGDVPGSDISDLVVV